VTAVLLGTLALVVASAVVGQAVCVLAGLRGAPPWAPAVGFAALLVVARVVIEAPGHASTAAAVLGGLVLVSAALTAARLTRVPDLLDRVPLVLGMIVLAALPFLVSGRAGILGVSVNNDMSSHLTAAWWLDARGPLAPVGALGDSLIAEGYPLGPHAVAAALARGSGMSLVQAFDAVTIVVPVLAALAAIGAMRADVPRLARWVAAALIGLCYLAAAFLAQSAFKETTMGMLLIAFLVALREILRTPARAPMRAGLPIGVLLGGMLYVYSLPGLAWPIGAVVAVVALSAVALRRAVLGHLRAAWPLAAGALLVAVVLAAPDIARLHDFASSSFAHEPKQNKGNLFSAIPAAQTLGIWLQGDFRLGAKPYALTVVLDVLALLALAGAVAWWLRRRDPAMPAALLATGLIAIDASITRNIYNVAKALAILAPVVALTLIPPLAEAWRRRPTVAPPARIAVRVLSLVLAVGAALSSLLALRAAPVGPLGQVHQLERLTAGIQGQRVLFLGMHDFAQWELRGTRLVVGNQLYGPQIEYARGLKLWYAGEELDFDNFTSKTLDGFPYVITYRSPFQSTPPANFRPVASTSQFVLLRRFGPTPVRQPLDEPGIPFTALPCEGARTRRLVARGGRALIVPEPLTVEPDSWVGQPSPAGRTVHQTIEDVPAGRWDVSLQYASNTGLELRAPGLRAKLPPTLERVGSYFLAGSVVQRHSGPLTITIHAPRVSALVGRLLRAPAATHALNSHLRQPLGRLVLTRKGVRPRLVPVASACGHSVDWVLPASARAARR
jgi:hypothetical protein